MEGRITVRFCKLFDNLRNYELVRWKILQLFVGFLRNFKEFINFNCMDHSTVHQLVDLRSRFNQDVFN